MKKYAFGVDVGGTTCKIGFFETDGKLIDKWEIKTNKENGGASILSDVAQAIEGKLTEKGISRDDVQGIGVGVPGPVKNDGVVHRCVNVGWGVVNVEKELGDLTGLKVKAGNDANVAALGEMWQGAAKGCRDVIMVTLGTGVGGGIIVDGKVVAGFDGAALRNHADLTAKDVFDEAKAGDKVALEVVDEVCGILGAALSNIACVVNPEVIVIGGGVSKAGGILTDAVKKHFAATSFHACANTKFVLAGLGNDAGMYGCVEMLLD